MTNSNLVEIEQNKLPKDIQGILDELKKSPAFAMSRGGRELFHTNFLAFILEETTVEGHEKTYTQKVKKSLLAQFFGDNNPPKNVLVFREKSHLDLIIIPEDDISLVTNLDFQDMKNIKEVDKSETELKIVVVEAKLKSIPTREQLEGYTDTINNVVTIDLFDDVNSTKLIIDKNKALVEVNNGKKRAEKKQILYKFKSITFDSILLAPDVFKIEVPAEWRNLQWGSLFEGLTKETLNEPISKIDYFVNDYILSTSNLLRLIEKIVECFNGFSDISANLKLDGLYRFATHDAFKKLRVHDLVGKVIYECLGKKIYEQISPQLKSVAPRDEKNPIFVYKAFLTNSTPGFQLEFVFKKNKHEVAIGVQLQGVDYRHYIRRTFTDEEKKLEVCATNIGSWLELDGNEGLKIKNSENKNNRCKKFDEDRFLYKSRKIPDAGFKNLVNTFTTSLINRNDDQHTAIDLIDCEDFKKALFGNL